MPAKLPGLPEVKPRGRFLKLPQQEAIVDVFLENPRLSVQKISEKIYAKHGKGFVSHGGIQSFLTHLGLTTRKQRTLFAKHIRKITPEEAKDLLLIAFKRQSQIGSLTPDLRLKAIRLVEAGVPVAHICRLFKISVANYYKWQKRYKESTPGQQYQAVSNRQAVVKRYWRQATPKQVKAVLKVVIDHPEFSTHKISAALPRIAGRPFLGNHGVQNVFRRLDLNTFEKRLVYAQAQKPVVTPTFGLPSKLRQLIGEIPAISSIPPPSREKLASLIRPFLISLFSSTLLSSGFFYWLRLMAQAPDLGGKLGLLFATLSLSVGGFFFIYSMKYYLTLALVLSFSRQPLEEGGGYSLGVSANFNDEKKNGLNGNGNGGLKGWLEKIFSISDSRENGNRGKGNGLSRFADLKNGLGINGSAMVGGLQPSLDHIKLKRKPFVSVHLPMYNEKRVAERLIKACASMNYYDNGQAQFEVLVCDDSTDETVEIVQRVAKDWNQKHKFGPKVRVLHRPTRKGFKGAALGFALKKVNPKTEFVVVFDADFVPYPDTLQLFAKYFKANQVLSGGKDQLNKNSKIAAVTGYQWHVLNKSENWITRGVRTEYAGSYVIERPGREILGLLKQIHGTVYMIRRDALEKVGWGTSITEDFQLTLKLYEAGYKVIYTPYVQAPAECVSTLKRLIRQRMRWAEGHSNCIKKKAIPLLLSPNLTFMEKLEILYLIPYYLQAFFFLIGTFSWLVSEAVFKVKLPFWTALWGWSLVLTNFFALPLVNAVGLFLEESEERDYIGLLSFVFLCYIIVPFQAYAAIKGFIEKEEGPWFRTPKTGKITDIFKRGSFYRWIAGILPGRSSVAASLRAPQVAPAYLGDLYLQRTSADNRFNHFKIKPKRKRWLAKAALSVLLAVTVTVFNLTRGASEVLATDPATTQYMTNATTATLTNAWQLQTSVGTQDTTTSMAFKRNTTGSFKYYPGVGRVDLQTGEAKCGTPDGRGWILDTPFQPDGSIDSGTWTFDIYENDAFAGVTGHLDVCVFKITVSGGTIQSNTLLFESEGNSGWSTADTWDGAGGIVTRTATSISSLSFNADEYLYIEYWNTITGALNGYPVTSLYTDDCGATDPSVQTPTITIPEDLVYFIATAPLIPLVVMWMRKKKVVFENCQLVNF